MFLKLCQLVNNNPEIVWARAFRSDISIFFCFVHFLEHFIYLLKYNYSLLGIVNSPFFQWKSAYYAQWSRTNVLKYTSNHFCLWKLVGKGQKANATARTIIFVVTICRKMLKAKKFAHNFLIKAPFSELNTYSESSSDPASFYTF